MGFCDTHEVEVMAKSAGKRQRVLEGHIRDVGRELLLEQLRHPLHPRRPHINCRLSQPTRQSKINNETDKKKRTNRENLVKCLLLLFLLLLS